jgi:protein EFR3
LVPTSYCAFSRSTNLRRKPLSPYLDEFRTRPAIERHAPSIHLHIDGERGPTKTDVCNACLRALSHLFDHSDGGQIAFVMQVSMTSLDQIKGWENVGHCCWFAGKATEWTQYQFRDAVPNRLIERLQAEQDVPTTTTLHIALATMIITVFTSPIPLVMSTSDVISNLITLVLRRAAIDPADSLLLALTECIGALGTHVYYADQIHDLASELISRLVSAEATGLPGRERDSSDKSRGQALRALIAGLVGLMSAPTRRVEQRSSGETPRSEHEMVSGSQKAADPVHSSSGDKPARVSIERTDGEARLTQRSKISPEIWQDTLNLICDVDFSVRSDYASALLVYLESEISTRGGYTDGDGVRRNRLAVSQLQQVGNVMAALHGDELTRFLHASHVYLYILATSPTFYDTAHSPSPPRSTTRKDSADITVIPATPDASREAIGGAEDRSSPARSQQGRLSFSLPTRTRKLSLVRRIISRLPTRITPSSPPSATASDYRNITSILIKIHEFLPVRGLITGVPFLLALSSVAYVDEYTDPGLLGTICATREVISRVWLALGRIWDCRELAEMAEKVGDIPLLQFCFDLILSKALSSIPDSSCLPREREARDLSRLSEPDVPVQISPVNDADCVWTGVDPERALNALTSSKNVLEATAMDSQMLRKRLSAQWTAESAFRDCASN